MSAALCFQDRHFQRTLTDILTLVTPISYFTSLKFELCPVKMALKLVEFVFWGVGVEA